MANVLGLIRLLFLAMAAGFSQLPPASGQIVVKPDRFGNAMQIALPTAAVALALGQNDPDGLKELGLSVALSQGTTELLKHGLHIHRPDGTGYGFPSGHTSMAFVSAAYVHRRYGLQWGAPMYGLAALTAYSRVRTHHHFTRDVVGGAAIGVASAFLLTHPLGPRTQAALIGTPGGVQFAFSAQW